MARAGDEDRPMGVHGDSPQIPGVVPDLLCGASAIHKVQVPRPAVGKVDQATRSDRQGVGRQHVLNHGGIWAGAAIQDLDHPIIARIADIRIPITIHCDCHRARRHSGIDVRILDLAIRTDLENCCLINRLSLINPLIYAENVVIGIYGKADDIGRIGEHEGILARHGIDPVQIITVAHKEIAGSVGRDRRYLTEMGSPRTPIDHLGE